MLQIPSKMKSLNSKMLHVLLKRQFPAPKYCQIVWKMHRTGNHPKNPKRGRTIPKQPRTENKMHARTIEGALLSNVLANEQFLILRGFQAKLSFSLTNFQFSYLDLGHRRMKHIEQYLSTLHAGPARDNSSARSHSKFVCFGCFWQLTSPGSS